MATTTTTRRRPRKATAAPAVLDGVMSAADSPSLGDDITPTTVLAEVEVQIPATRDAEGYTVDLLDKGEDNDKRNYAKLLEKDPSELHQSFVDWTKAKSGYTPDAKTVQLVLALYQEFQRSPEHRQDTHAKREAAAQKKAAAQASKIARLQKAAAELAELQKAAKATAKK